MRLKLITAPTATPVSVTRLATHLRLTTTGAAQVSDYLEALIDEAVSYIDGPNGVGVCMMSQTWELALDELPDQINIPIYPLQSVTSITYTDTDGEAATLAAENYIVNDYGMSPTITPASNVTWPSTADQANAVKVRFVCGFETLPQVFEHAVLLLAGHWYNNREAVTARGFTEPPFSVTAILDKYRVAGIA